MNATKRVGLRKRRATGKKPYETRRQGKGLAGRAPGAADRGERAT